MAFSCGSNCELIPFLEDSFPVPAAEKPQAPPPFSTSKKEALGPFHLLLVSSRTGVIAQSYLSVVRSGSYFYSKQIKTKLDHLAGGDLFLSACLSYRKSGFRLIFRKASHHTIPLSRC